MASPQILALLNALRNVRTIAVKIEGTNGGLTKTVFSTPGSLSDGALDNARGAIGLELQALVQNIRALKTGDPILVSYPNIHYRLNDSVARCNWLAHEYGTTAPIKWHDVAHTVYDDLPVIETDIIAALKANGVPNP